MNLDSLYEKTINLFHYCKRTGDWEPELDCRPLQAFADEAIKHKKILSNWEAMTAYHIIQTMLGNFKVRIVRNIDNDLCKEFVEKFIKFLSKNKTTHLLVLPVINASANSMIEFERFIVIPHTFSRDEKIKILADKSNKLFEDTKFLAKHTEISRSPNFFNHTLFCIKINHQTAWVNIIARQIAMWNIAFLRALFYGRGYKEPSLLIKQPVLGPENKHMLILAKQHWRCSHLPLLFNSRCSFPLNWLKKKDVQTSLASLNKILMFSDDLDRLSYRFKRSFRLFSRAIDLREMREPFEGIGLSVLFLMIAAEGILLDRESEKRVRLSCLLPKFADPLRISKKQAYEVVNNCYQWRSDFVHSGSDRFLEYDEELNTRIHEKEYSLLREMVARLLLNCPKYINHAKNRAKKNFGNKKDLDKYESEREWFNYLRKSWERSLSS